jgi:hypothetical protein
MSRNSDRTPFIYATSVTHSKLLIAQFANLPLCIFDKVGAGSTEVLQLRNKNGAPAEN